MSEIVPCRGTTQIAEFMGPTCGPPGSCRPQMGPMLASWTLLSGKFLRLWFTIGELVNCLSFSEWSNAFSLLTMLKLVYSVIFRLISWLLITWLRVSQGYQQYQQPWSWFYRRNCHFLTRGIILTTGTSVLGNYINCKHLFCVSERKARTDSQKSWEGHAIYKILT